ncbi:hypothetical protein V6255_00980 [Psychromonas arctica]|uniref:Uncharacterized protein n=1 Tax=Psychromonas arctica TaxID=168275 RepID=A0ABU9H751_9GAMM
MAQSLLFRDYIYPVTSPDLLKKPEYLNKTILLHDSLPQAKFRTIGLDGYPN